MATVTFRIPKDLEAPFGVLCSRWGDKSRLIEDALRAYNPIKLQMIDQGGGNDNGTKPAPKRGGKGKEV